MSRISPFLLFDNQAEEAMTFYVSVFKNAKAGQVVRMGDKVLVASFELEGLPFTALNGGPKVKFTEAMSLYVNCETQQDVDHLWDKLTADGGAPGQCGWLKDKFGISWQIIPSALPRLMSDPDRAKAGRVAQAMMQMGKIEIEKLEAAANG